MTCEEHTGVIDWLSDVEASVRLRHPSLRCALVSPSTPPSPSPSSHSPNSSALLRKRKHEPKKIEPSTKKLRLTRRALREIMVNQGRRAGDTVEGDWEQVEANVENHSTPTKQPSSSTSQSNPKTPSNSSAKIPPAAKLTPNVHNVRQSLARHGMRFDETAAFDRCPEFKQKIDYIFEKERASRMKESSIKAAKTTLKQYYTQNERTLFRELRPQVIKDTRTVTTNKRDAEGVLITILKEYKEDNLISIEDCHFLKNLLPGKDYTPYEEKDLGLTNPVPDMTYGLREPDYPPVGKSPKKSILALKCVAPGMEWPFFVVEHKSWEEGIAVSENQAIRDGAVLVNARMQLSDTLRSTRLVGAYEDSFVFSCAWVPEMAKIFVHWVERLEDGTDIFHMNMLKDYIVSRDQEMADFRRDLHNVIDWGLFQYVPAAQAVYDKIMAKA